MRVETIILTGIIFSSFLGAIISLMIALTGDELRQIIGWLLGSVSMRGWEYIKIILPFFIIGSAILIFNAKELNAMSFGEERAQHLGVNVQKRKLIDLDGRFNFNRSGCCGFRDHWFCWSSDSSFIKIIMGSRSSASPSFIDYNRKWFFNLS